MPVPIAFQLLDNTTNGEAQEHFRLCLSAMMTRLLTTIANNPRLEHLYIDYPFLQEYRDSIHEFLPGDLDEHQYDMWWQQTIAGWEARHPTHLPIRTLTSAIGQQAVWYTLAAGLIEEDIRFGALFAALHAPLKHRHPSIGLLGLLLDDPDYWITCRSLVESGLVIVENQQDARAEWLLRLPPAIWDALSGYHPRNPVPGLEYKRADSFPFLRDLIISDDLQAQVWQAPDLIRSGQLNAMVVRGMKSSGRLTLLGSVASAIQRDVLVYEGEPKESQKLLGPLCTMMGAMPIIRCNPSPGETVDLEPLKIYNGPVGVTLGRAGGVNGIVLQNALTLTLLPPDYDARRKFWQVTKVPIQEGEAGEIACRFLLTGGLIQRAATLGYTYSKLDKRASLSVEDVQKALRALNRQSLDTLATHLESANGWDDLVVHELVQRELGALEVRCLERERLREGAGVAFNRNLNRGVRAMFSGPSGTGKTLAARALAGVLQMDLYRVDLASVVNKYIGETERNLNEVFSKAEELDVILLLDEGDSLMTKRTDVSNANDRYANLETNYLLQRLEVYEGIVIITTNAAQRIDSAFTRRLDVVIEFSKPQADERRELWEVHLPAEHDITPEFMEKVVILCALTGGQIRNAALFALLLALNEKVAVNDVHLQSALQREYRNAGASFPLHIDQPSNQSQLDKLKSFAKKLG